MEQLRCYDCGKFMSRPYDSRTTFGCADPGAPEPYNPDYFCRKCATKLYKKLLASYKCCGRSGDYEKSDAEVRAAKEAGLIWISEPHYDIRNGNFIFHRYASPYEKSQLMGYENYEKKLRDENRCCVIEALSKKK